MATMACHPGGSPAFPLLGRTGQGTCRHHTRQHASSLMVPEAPMSTRRGSYHPLRCGSFVVRAAEDAELQRQHLQQQQTNGLNQVAHPQVTRRQLAAASLSALSLPSALALSYALPGQLAHAAEAEEKRKNLPLNELKDIIARDISDGQYFVTGELTRAIYREDCKFKDPTNTTVGVGKYLAAIGILFDPRYSKHELLTIETTTADGAPAIKATWKLGGYLKFPWRPRVVPFTGSTTYVFDSDGLVALHDETWGISPATALLETFTPTFGPRQLL